jgi:hypothetical protein
VFTQKTVTTQSKQIANCVTDTAAMQRIHTTPVTKRRYTTLWREKSYHVTLSDAMCGGVIYIANCGA